MKTGGILGFIEDKESEMNIPDGFSHWTAASMLGWMALSIVKVFFGQRALKKEVLGLRSEVEKFLRPQIRFYIGDKAQRRIKMKDTEKAVAAIELDDAKGYPTGGAFDQPPVWSIDDETIATLNPAADGMSCEVVGQKPGNATVSVAGVMGGQSFQGSCPAVVTSGDPVAIKVTLGAAVPQ